MNEWGLGPIPIVQLLKLLIKIIIFYYLKINKNNKKNMNYTSGAFKCPKCKEGSFTYKKWKKRNIYFENHIINDWIFYESSEIRKDYTFFNYLKGESFFKCFFEYDYCNN